MKGARLEDWQHFDLVLGLGEDLLPVVPDAAATPSPGSKIKQFGKIPSVYDANGNAHGLKDWQKRKISPSDIERWSKDDRLSMCVRASAVRAIDVDIDEPVIVDGIRRALADFGLPERTRSNSAKALFAFRLAGAHAKRIITTAKGRIEFLADGQQFVAAGSHPSGAAYTWVGGLPEDIPTLSTHQFEAIWASLSQLGTPETPRGDGAGEPHADNVLAEITAPQLADLREALSYKPLLDAAIDNDTWSEIGYALITLGALGFELWVDFSERAPNYERGAPQTWWAAHEGQEARSDYRHIFTMARRLGWKSIADIEAFPVVVSEPGEAPPSKVDMRQPVIARVPQSFHLCTDQRNANRIQDAYGGRLICVGGVFYSWTGKYWRRDEKMINWACMMLPALVRQEKIAAKKACDELVKLDADIEATFNKWVNYAGQGTRKTELRDEVAERSLAIVEAHEKYTMLAKWEIECESAPRQARALDMLRKAMDLPATELNAAPHLFNCENGTIDLRTGELKPHDPLDFITACSPVKYNPQARCPRFVNFLREILDDERATFMHRYLGYSITGETREQKVVLHIGEGGNGKGTLFRVIQHVLGNEMYFHTAPDGFLTVTKGGERHPTEIAGLIGKRFVSVSESEENAQLRESFMKHLSGEDPIAGRFMRQDFFTFMPVCKLHLQTNHEPNVRGTDHGIWRRLVLIRYTNRYGDANQLAAGLVERLQDKTLTDQLLGEAEGILAWMVEGARAWYADGLTLPASVTHDVAAYRDEQDRARQFVRDRCVVEPQAMCPFSGPFGIYDAYREWCRSQGFEPQGIIKFGRELQRVVPTLKRDVTCRKVGDQWRTLKVIKGIRVDADGAVDGVETPHGDLL
ncbi:MAG: bifunctional DNA primase/polymerase [Patescibacteria group bacterium]|nr:bifunctional DNA primase/polymerase [Patescibacteria group bacterium]